jgi:hypothetical protein
MRKLKALLDFIQFSIPEKISFCYKVIAKWNLKLYPRGAKSGGVSRQHEESEKTRTHELLFLKSY